MNPTCSIPLGPDHEAAVLRVLRRGILVDGPEIEALENEFAGWLGVEPARVVAVSSGTAALEALLLAHGVGVGDEVLVPGVTFTATALAVLRVGARPVLVDVNGSWTLSSSALEKAIGPATVAAIGVDLDGSPANWDRIEKAGRDLFLIEDACPAFGARYKGDAAGTLGRDGAAFSMNESKQLPAGEGGFVVAPYSAIADRIRRMRHFGHGESSGPVWQRGVAVEEIGDNWKMTECAAAIARASLPTLTDRVMNSRLVGEIIRGALAESPVLAPASIAPGAEPSWYRLRAVASSANEAMRIMTILDREGVGVTGREEVAPLREHPMFADLRRGLGDLPNAKESSRSFCIGSRQKQVFAIDPAEAERWAEVISSLPSKLVSPRSKEEA
jgi:perosamine synthetase